MISFTNSCYAAVVSRDERSSSILAYFTKEQDAIDAGIGKGWWGSNGTASKTSLDIIIYESLDEYQSGAVEKMKEAALAKLTPRERELLGL